MVIKDRSFRYQSKARTQLLLVIKLNLIPILPHFSDIAGFSLKRAILPIFYTKIGGISFGLDCRSCGYNEQRLMIDEIAFVLTKLL